MKEPIGVDEGRPVPYSQASSDFLAWAASEKTECGDLVKIPPFDADRDEDSRRRYAAILLAERGQ